MYEIKIYKTSTGKEPYTDWIKDLDRFIRSKINSRMARIRDTGNFGDCKHFDYYQSYIAPYHNPKMKFYTKNEFE